MIGVCCAVPHWRWKAAAALGLPLKQLPEHSNPICTMLLERVLPYMTALLTSPGLTITSKDLAWLIEEALNLHGDDATKLLHVMLATKTTTPLTGFDLRVGIKEAAQKGAWEPFKLVVEAAAAAPAAVAAGAGEAAAVAVAAGPIQADGVAVAAQVPPPEPAAVVLLGGLQVVEPVPFEPEQRDMAERFKVDILRYALRCAAYYNRPKMVSWVLQLHPEWTPFDLGAAMTAAVSRGWVVVLRKLLKESEVMWSYGQVYFHVKQAKQYHCKRTGSQMARELMSVTEYYRSKWSV